MTMSSKARELSPEEIVKLLRPGDKFRVTNEFQYMSEVETHTPYRQGKLEKHIGSTITVENVKCKIVHYRPSLMDEPSKGTLGGIYSADLVWLLEKKILVPTRKITVVEFKTDLEKLGIPAEYSDLIID